MSWRHWRGLILGILAVIILDVVVLALVLRRALETNTAVAQADAADGVGADLRFSQGGEVASLDPAKITGLIGGRVASALFEGLTVVNPKTQKARPGVARRWTISPDGLVYTFHLRDDARWSDGSRVTAQDFLYSWRRVLDVETAAQYNYMLFPIKGAEAYAKATAWRAALAAEDSDKVAADFAAALAKIGGSVTSADDARRAVREAVEKLEVSALSPRSVRLVSASVAEVLKRPAVSPGTAGRVVAQALKEADIAVLTLEEAQRAVPAARDAVGIEVVSPFVLRVTLRQPTHYFLELVAFTTYLPVKRECVETTRDGKVEEDSQWVFPQNIVSNGPYILRQRQYKSLMRLARNPTYWNPEGVRLKVIDIFPIEEQETCFIGYERGELDFITTVPTLAGEQLLRQHRQGRRPDFSVTPNLGTYYYRFNVTRKPLDDVRVRKALTLAVDKDAIVVKGGRLGQPVANVLVPPGIPGYQGPEGLAPDPELARRLLAEAGFPGGRGFPKLTLLYNTSEGHKAIAELVYESWRRELGIKVEPKNVEWKVYLDRCRKLDFDIARAGWYGDYVDPNTFLDMFVTGGGNNNTGWSHAEYDGLIKEAAETLDPVERMAVFRRAETILVEEHLPIIPLYHYVGAMLVKPHVRGWHANLRNDILFQDLWIETAKELR